MTAPTPVLLVGAGPGDPDLLTLRAEAALRSATLVVTDAAVAPLAHAFAPSATVLVAGPERRPEVPAAPAAARGDASPGGAAVVVAPNPRSFGASAGGAATAAERRAVSSGVAEALAGEVGRGGSAVRLYRGDPWMHRAFAAEAAGLRERGVLFEAVPGPVAELALLAEAGVAVHHRPHAVTVTLALPDDLPEPVDPARTLVAEEGS